MFDTYTVKYLPNNTRKEFAKLAEALAYAERIGSAMVTDFMGSTVAVFDARGNRTR